MTTEAYKQTVMVRKIREILAHTERCQCGDFIGEHRTASAQCSTDFPNHYRRTSYTYAEALDAILEVFEGKV